MTMSDPAKRIIETAKADAAIANLEAMMPQIVRQADVLARMRRIHYNAAIRHGFTPDQALALCMAPVSGA